jgi:hypothetical protein
MASTPRARPGRSANVASPRFRAEGTTHLVAIVHAYRA